MIARPKLLFVAPWFLFPKTNGGRIRTVDILRGLKGGRFEITLASPDSADRLRYARDLGQVCDRFAGWPAPEKSRLFALQRLRYLFSELPVSIATDRSEAAVELVEQELRRRPDVVVVDFVHTTVLVRDRLDLPSVLFTHNVEAEIFQRHATVAGSPVHRFVWRDQHRKMRRFEAAALRRFDTVVAVSERDRRQFEEVVPSARLTVIPTGVDLDFFRPARAPATPDRAASGPRRVVFTGSMDWAPNVDAISYLMREIWSGIASQVPDVELVVVGRNPPDRLIQQARRSGFAWRFTGLVDDVRPYVHGSDVYAIPLRVGGGTRLKVFEAMAMGCPVVSTSIGVEGLPVVPGRHCLVADGPRDFIAATTRLLRDQDLRRRLSAEAFRLVADHFSAGAVARIFEGICASAAGLGEPSDAAAREPLMAVGAKGAGQ